MSDEVVNASAHDTDSEQSASEDDEKSHVSTELLLGKDGITKWVKNPLAKSSKTKAKNITRIQPGPKNNLTSESELDSFLTQFSISMIDEIVYYTNISINRKQANFTRRRDCHETSREELMAVLGVLFLIGTKKGHHVNVRELWASDGSGMAILRAVMSYRRFLFILSTMTFDDKDTRVERRKQDKLAAIRSIFDKFVHNIKNTYSCSEDVTIDEMLLSFRGRCSWIQYIPSKPAKYGLKFFAMVDANTFFTNNLEIYVGKQPDGPFAKSNTPRDIVDRLTVPIEGSWRTLTTDNWYTSIPLAETLFQKKITLIGTLRKNKREIPPSFQPNKNTIVGTAQFAYRKDMTLVSYSTKKNKNVILLSTTHDDGIIDVETRKPEIIMDYNRTKGGVDTVDKLSATFSVSRITRRWSLAAIYGVLNLSGNILIL